MKKCVHDVPCIHSIDTAAWRQVPAITGDARGDSAVARDLPVRHNRGLSLDGTQSHGSILPIPRCCWRCNLQR